MQVRAGSSSPGRLDSSARPTRVMVRAPKATLFSRPEGGAQKVAELGGGQEVDVMGTAVVPAGLRLQVRAADGNVGFLTLEEIVNPTLFQVEEGGAILVRGTPSNTAGVDHVLRIGETFEVWSYAWGDKPRGQPWQDMTTKAPWARIYYHGGRDGFIENGGKDPVKRVSQAFGEPAPSEGGKVLAALIAGPAGFAVAGTAWIAIAQIFKPMPDGAPIVIVIVTIGLVSIFYHALARRFGIRRHLVAAAAEKHP